MPAMLCAVLFLRADLWRSKREKVNPGSGPDYKLVDLSALALFQFVSEHSLVVQGSFLDSK